MAELAALAERLLAESSVRDKIAIRDAYAPAEATVGGGVLLGDDCAALPDGPGLHLLFAAEGLLPGFVEDDPWFAGYSAVMVNLSDIAAMGGRPLAIVDVIWTPDDERTQTLWQGMQEASRAYGVPIVGGHTTRTGSGSSLYLAAAVMGRARSLMTSFDAEPGDDLLMAIDLRGHFRRDKPFWNASTERPGEALRGDLELLPEIAEAGLCRAAKDISNGGILGTLVMLLECSQVGATLDLDAIPCPPNVELFRWLISFPSYGYLLSVKPEQQKKVVEIFQARGISCQKIGRIETDVALNLETEAECCEFWRGDTGTGSGRSELDRV